MVETIAVVAQGAMGAAIGARLHRHGVRVLTWLEGRSEASRKRAAAAGMQAADEPALAGADIILSVVPPDQALAQARWFARRIAAAGTAPLYADLNAINPASMREVAQALDGTRARVVDGSIIGGPPGEQGRGPTVYVSGEAADDALPLGARGLAVRVLPGGIGAASALKMSYAGLTKGFTALGAAMILGAQREGAAEALHAELADSQKELLARLGKSIPDMLPKAYRWAPEMAEIAAFLGQADPASGIYDAMAELYRRIAADLDQTGDALRGFFAAPPAPPAP